MGNRKKSRLYIEDTLDDELALWEEVENDLLEIYQEEDAYDSHSLEEDFGQLDLDIVRTQSHLLAPELYLSLFEDPHHRFFPHQHLYGHALISTNSNQYTAQQFEPPVSRHYGTHYTPIHNIQLFTYQGQTLALGEAEDGTPMIARRSIEVGHETDESTQQSSLLLFSPLFDARGKVKSLGSHQSVPLCSDEESRSKQKSKKRDFLEQSSTQKGGQVTLNQSDIHYRENHKRKPTQKKVMGRKSAQEIMHRFYQDYQDILSPSMKTLMEYVLTQKNEWTHALGYRLTPLSRNPQVKENLVAGPFWLNSKMNVTERFAIYHATHAPTRNTEVTCWLETLKQSEVLDKGYIEAKVKNETSCVTIRQSLNAWLEFPVYSHVTDVAQAVLVSEALLQNKSALYTQSVKHLGTVSQLPLQETETTPDDNTHRLAVSSPL